MRSTLATTALMFALAAPAFGQLFGGNRGSSGGKVTAPPTKPFAKTPPSSGATPRATGSSNASKDSQVFRTGAALPEPTPESELEAPKIPLPEGPIDPYLIQKENGPFMVLAHTFRGPHAAKYAQALVMELRNKYRLPAYIFFAKVHPGNSNIRNVQPTAPVYAKNGDMAPPEKFRNYDEAAVLVGDCKSVEESKLLLKKVKHLRPTTVDNLPTIYNWRIGKGLSRAMLTANPLVPSQNLYPGKDVPVIKPGQAFDPSVVTAGFATPKIAKADRLVKQINKGPHSIYKCPGPYVLLVGEFEGGRMDTTSQKDLGPGFAFRDKNGIKRSPLAEAGEQAERLAEAISKSATLRAVGHGLRPYTYHDRYASRVYIGPFKSGNDPALVALLRDPVTGSLVQASYQRGQTRFSKMTELANELLRYNPPMNLAPATELTAVDKE